MIRDNRLIIHEKEDLALKLITFLVGMFQLRPDSDQMQSIISNKKTREKQHLK